MLVHRSRYDEAVDLAAEYAGQRIVGDPRDPASDLGPLVSAATYERVRGYIELGEREGARVVAGGLNRDGLPATGYYVRPTVFADANNDMRIAREEIFGPVLTVIRYDTEEQAIAIANDSPYGLHGAVWAGDLDHAVAVARRIKTGRVDVNGGELNLVAPFGGFKQSGNGRELGVHGLQDFTELKAVQFPAGVSPASGGSSPAR